MTRRQLLAGLMASPAVLGLRAAQPPYPGVRYRDYSQCLPDYLRRLVKEALERRNRALDGLTTPEAIRARQEWARNTFWQISGQPPERTALNVRTLNSFTRSGYRVENLVYESQPGFHVPANLYIPTDRKPPFPGVLFQLGHSPNGKAYTSYQRACQGLVRLGYLVLAFDPIGQGERIFHPDATGQVSLLGGADEEHTAAGRQLLLAGLSCTWLQTWDAVRSLDVLASHPSVDPKRLASTGQSGGATLTMFLACVDDRLAAAAEFSGNTENLICADFIPPGSTDDAEQDFVGGGPLGFDRWDTLYPFAPKPLLISVSDKDWFGTYSPSYLSNGWPEYQRLAKVYASLNASDKLAWTSTPLPHSLAYDSRVKVYNWMRRWLEGAPPVDKEPPTAPEPDQVLRVGMQATVVRSFGGRTPAGLVKVRREQPSGLPGLLALDPPKTAPAPAVLSRAPWGGLTVEAIEFSPEPGMYLPAWLYVPEKQDGRVAILLHPGGRNQMWQEGGICEELANRGLVVCAPDLRGIGDASPEFGRGPAAYAGGHHNDEDYAWASLILGRPFAGQLAGDILALAAALRTRFRRDVSVAALGKLTAPALFAASLDPQIKALYLAGGIVSFQDAIDRDTDLSGNALVPGILLHTDLPELAAGLAPRRLVVAGAKAGNNAPIPEAEVRRLYPGSHIQIRPASEWDAEHLAAALT